ncbi:hypothetical protein ATZ33_10315 [Enterococcus silesiacus]|uniref:Uncharacterized protein n=1 Tax=Enterococcus silesiacus TaxID=332949 RepID=A0A0S3KCE9_9ENTE|nr:hypothetical protein [Enterococcus silesiacus]ALS01753.1 hypothetical protein ATZ33_10315 [Enterococcus silesiacus]OJG87563.1 hypothetical protein RV15_GL001956 [Enterococcus silesiacus]
MDKEEELKLEYMKEVRICEEKENQLAWNKRKIFQEIDDYVKETEYWAGKLPYGREAISEAYHHFQNESLELEDRFHQERKKIMNEMEELEENYRKELRNLEN